jgi:hypothetical protein
MGRILLGVLLGALAASMLTMAFIWLAPLVALVTVILAVMAMSRANRRAKYAHDTIHRGWTQSSAEPMKSARPDDPDILLLTEADMLHRYRPGYNARDFRF